MTDNQVDAAVAFTLDNWDALGVREHSDVLHLPAVIKRRNKAGGLDEVPVMLRNVTNTHKFKARALAREHSLRLKLDLDRDKDLIDEVENYHLLAFAIRDPKTYDQHVPTAETLIDRYDAQSLAEVWGRYNVWVEMLDPRFGQLDAEQLWQVIARIAREKNPGFLAGFVGHAQFTIVTFMASQAILSPMRPSWLQSSATSTLAS